MRPPSWKYLSGELAEIDGLLRDAIVELNLMNGGVAKGKIIDARERIAFRREQIRKLVYVEQKDLR